MPFPNTRRHANYMPHPYLCFPTVWVLEVLAEIRSEADYLMLRARVFLSFTLFTLCHAYINKYDHQILKVAHLEYRRVGMYTAADAPAVGPPGNGESYIDIDVTLERSPQAQIGGSMQEGSLQILLSHASTVNQLGYRDYSGSRHFCCTQDLLNLKVPGCTEPSQIGKAIVPEVTPQVRSKDVSWTAGELVQKVSAKYEVSETGRYYLLFASCLDGTGDVAMSGEIIWMNPFGYLPGELYPFVQLFGWLSAFYGAIFCLWGAMCLIYRADLLQLQHYITVVIVLGLAETLTWYYNYDRLNQTGVHSFPTVILGVLLSSVKRTLSRILVLVVCMGFGVVKPSLSVLQRRKVLVLGVVYLIFSSLSDIISVYSQTTQALQRMRAFFLLPVAALDSLFLLWTLQEIQFNVQKLSQREQAAKLLVFRRFWQICVAAAFFSVSWALFQIYISVRTDEDERWEHLWTFEGAWHAIYLLVLFAIAFLWRPSTHTTAYAYSEQLRMHDEEEELEEMSMGTRPSSKAIAPAFAIDGEDVSDEE